MKKTLIALSLAASISLNAAVVATVNGEKITDTDILGPRASEFSKIPAETKKKLIDAAVVAKILIKEAKDSGIKKTEEFKNAMKTLEDRVALQVWQEKEFNAIKIDGKDIKKFYDENKDKLFTKEASVKASHILVKTKAEADKIYKELKGLKDKALASKFAKLANEKSMDKASAAQGGELGWFGKSQMVPEFSNAAFALKTGSISAPVKSAYGYHIIYKEDAKAKSVMPYDKVKDVIENNLKQQKLAKVMEEKIEALKAKAKIEYK